MAVRDNNEMSWTQVLDLLEFISDATTIPLLLDGDTGYGNFNNMRRLVKKLEARDVAAVCIEDKIFPKTNSYINGEQQVLADVDEFCGKIKAGKDAQSDPDFSIVARVEALIAGLGLKEALRRADAYHRAGADAILIHSKLSRADEIIAFKKEWGDRCPVVIVPTTYYGTPTSVFREAGISVIIWANHLLRSAMTAMKTTAEQLVKEQTLVNIEERVATVKDIFALQGADELQEAEKRYMPEKPATEAVILAAARGASLGALTVDKPKAMIQIGGRPLIDRMVETLNSVGIKKITVVRGYKKEAIDRPALKMVDNDDFASTQEVYSFAKGLRATNAPMLMCYGDVLCHKYIVMNLLESDADFCIAVDSDWQASRNRGRYGDFVTCTAPYNKMNFTQPAYLVEAHGKEWRDTQGDKIHGEFMGLMKVSPAGCYALSTLLSGLAETEELRTMRMTDLLNRLIAMGQKVEVIYTRGHWLDVDEVQDVTDAGIYGTVRQ